jgi:hypothetical protein
MVAETYSNVGRSLRLTWLKVWEKYLKERCNLGRGELSNAAIAAGVALRSRIKRVPKD